GQSKCCANGSVIGRFARNCSRRNGEPALQQRPFSNYSRKPCDKSWRWRFVYCGWCGKYDPRPVRNCEAFKGFWNRFENVRFQFWMAFRKPENGRNVRYGWDGKYG